MPDNQALPEGFDDAVADVQAAITSLSNQPANEAGGESPEGLPPDQPSARDQGASSPSGDRPRDEMGRFVAKPDEPESPPAKPVEAQKAPEIPADKTVTQEQPAQAQSALGLPGGYPPAVAQHWASLPPAVQAALIQRNEMFDRGAAQWSERMKPWKEIEGVLAPRRESFARNGFRSDVEAVNHLMSFSDMYDRDPASLVAHLIRSKNVPLDSINAALAGQPQQYQPGYQAQQPSYQPIQQQPQNIEALIEDRVGQRFANLEIAEFAANPEHKHFETLKPLMATFLQSGQAATLKDAYDMAMWATPTLRTELLTAQQAQIKQQDVQKAQERAQQAKKASGASLNGAPHGATQTPQRPQAKNTFDDVAADVADAWAAHA